MTPHLHSHAQAHVKASASTPSPPSPSTPKAPLAERTTALGETTLLKRAAEPAEIAEAIAFLASPRAAYITCATLPIDGGRSAI